MLSAPNIDLNGKNPNTPFLFLLSPLEIFLHIIFEAVFKNCPDLKFWKRKKKCNTIFSDIYRKRPFDFLLAPL